MSRVLRIALAVVGLAVFLGVSGLLARVFAGNGAERSAVIDLLHDQARGDAPALIAGIRGCAAQPVCVARARGEATRLRRAGPVQILRYDASSSFAPFGHRGTARVVWRTPATLSVVQCLKIRRAGALDGGPRAVITALGPPIGREAACK